jgi:hypothetical protein
MQWGGPDKEVPSPFWVCLFFFFSQSNTFRLPNDFCYIGLAFVCAVNSVLFALCIVRLSHFFGEPSLP